MTRLEMCFLANVQETKNGKRPGEFLADRTIGKLVSRSFGSQERQRHRAHVHPAQICSTLHTVGVSCVSFVQSLHKNALSMVTFGAAKLIVQTVQTEVRLLAACRMDSLHCAPFDSRRQDSPSEGPSLTATSFR